MKKVVKILLDHDGAQSFVPEIRLSNRWPIGAKVTVTIELKTKRKK